MFSAQICTAFNESVNRKSKKIKLKGKIKNPLKNPLRKSSLRGARVAITAVPNDSENWPSGSVERAIFFVFLYSTEFSTFLIVQEAHEPRSFFSENLNV